jgi:hypothetical protein
MTSGPEQRRKRDVWVSRFHRRPAWAIALTAGLVLLLVALVSGMPWSALGHGTARLSVPGWFAVAGAVYVVTTAAVTASRLVQGGRL